MPYKLSLDTFDKTLLLEIYDEYKLEEVKEVNDAIIYELNQSRGGLFVLVDATKMSRPYNFAAIRSGQTFMDHLKLKAIYVIANDRLIKLSIMVIFNLSRAPLYINDNLEKSMMLLQKHV